MLNREERGLDEQLLQRRAAQKVTPHLAPEVLQVIGTQVGSGLLYATPDDTPQRKATEREQRSALHDPEVHHGVAEGDPLLARRPEALPAEIGPAPPDCAAGEQPEWGRPRSCGYRDPQISLPRLARCLPQLIREPQEPVHILRKTVRPRGAQTSAETIKFEHPNVGVQHKSPADISEQGPIPRSRQSKGVRTALVRLQALRCAQA
mmetsp:Transcript_26031/g.74534  ORF Transcript_26031/g.74534 Transcript_26031/m.74534 type:complete len:206 (+) Transcript_26031:532-1149(+)